MNREHLHLYEAAIVAAIFLGITGCRQDMQNQPEMIPLRHTTFFMDCRSRRQRVAGTIARSQPFPDGYLATGLLNGSEGDVLPFPVTIAILRRGQERFNI